MSVEGWEAAEKGWSRPDCMLGQGLGEEALVRLLVKAWLKKQANLALIPSFAVPEDEAYPSREQLWSGISQNTEMMYQVSMEKRRHHSVQIFAPIDDWAQTTSIAISRIVEQARHRWRGD
jgi:hypothetical protein